MLFQVLFGPALPPGHNLKYLFINIIPQGVFSIISNNKCRIIQCINPTFQKYTIPHEQKCKNENWSITPI